MNDEQAELARENWADGNEYEHYVGRWSSRIAPQFLAWLAVTPGRNWLEVGCGTGALTEAIIQHCAPSVLHAVEPSQDYLAAARSRLGEERVTFHRSGGETLPLPDESVDASVSGLVLNFIPDKASAVAEQTRVLVSGGVAAAYVWDYAGRMELMRYFWDAAVALDPAAQEKDEGLRFPIARQEAMARLWQGAGLAQVETREVDVPTVFPDFEDYWRPFLGGQGPAPGYCMSLGEEQRAALRERVRATLPIQPDGSIRLIARALAVKGTKP